MPDAKSQGQADKAATEQRSEQDQQAQERKVEARSAAEKVLKVDRSESAVDPYPAYDFMTLEQLRSLASERGVEINRDVEKAHLITELRAADSGSLSVAARKGAR